MLQRLIKLYQNVTLRDPELTDVLQRVVLAGSQKSLEFILGIPWFVASLHQKSPELLSMLYLLAAMEGDLPIMSFLLAENIDGTLRFPSLNPAYHMAFSEELGGLVITAKSSQHYPQMDAMTLAARFGNSEIVEYLLMLKESGKEAFQQIDPIAENYSALIQAILFKHEPIIDMLFKFVDSKVVSSRIFEACSRSDNVKSLKALAEMGIFTKASSAMPITLTRACSQGSLDVVKYILEDLLNFELAPVVEDMEMNLLGAVGAGKVDIVQYLLQKKNDGSLLFQGIDLAACSTKLFENAVYNRRDSIIDFLLSNVREHIDIRIIDTIPSFYYRYDPIFHVIIKERYGPCSFAVNSLWEKVWFKWIITKYYTWD